MKGIIAWFEQLADDMRFLQTKLAIFVATSLITSSKKWKHLSQQKSHRQVPINLRIQWNCK